MEIIQKFPGFRYVVAAAAKARDTLLLLSYASFTLGNMLLGLLQMTNLHRGQPIECGAALARSLPRPMQTGAQCLSATGAYAQSIAGDADKLPHVGSLQK